MDSPIIYLAGPVAATDDGGAGWREAISEEYGADYGFHNPLDKYNVPVDTLEVVDGTSDPDTGHTVGVDELVAGDKKLLRESDGVLVGYVDVHSVGTPMEVMWARERDYPVALWIRDDTAFDGLSPWYRHHATALTNDLELALGHIKNSL
jgi:hypothetical protein